MKYRVLGGVVSVALVAALYACGSEDDPENRASTGDSGAPDGGGTGTSDAAAGTGDAASPQDAGQDAKPLVEPAWRKGIAVGTWTEIPGTSGIGGAAIDAWGAFAENKATGEMYVAASGGHSDSADNRVVSLDLHADAPTWVQRHASSANPVTDVLYYPDGLPTSRHLYQHLHFLPTKNAVLLGGCRYGYGGGTPTGPGMDAFDLATNKWLAQKTFADITPFDGYVVEIDGDGNAWSTSGNRFTTATNTWSKPGTGPGLGRFPQATAPSRKVIFGLQFGDGQGYDLNLGVVARKLDTTTGNSVAITFNASAALTEFTTAQPNYAGMDYDAANDRFLFYWGGERGKVYVVKPNDSTTWDISTLPVTGMPEATPTSGSGINKRFRYFPTLGGFVLMPRRESNLYFLPTQ